MKKIWYTWLISVVFLFIAAFTLCAKALERTQAVAAFDDTGMRIVLDAGHGGIDGGVTGRNSGVRESDVNLAITLKLKEKLEEMGFDVILTRKTDAGLYDTTAKGFKRRDMEKRREIIQKANPAFVLSIHQNYYPSATSRGAQIFYEQNSEKSYRLANVLQDKMNGIYALEGVKERKAMIGEYFILRCADCPSVILECGFLSNAKDEALLTDGAWQVKLSEAIAMGVMQYLFDAAS